MKKKTDNQILSGLIKKIDKEKEFSEAGLDPEHYYEAVEEYGATQKLNRIINDFDAYKSELSTMYEKIDLNIGIICDEFLYYSLKDATNLKYISYTEFLEVDNTLDLLIVVSSWRGVDHSWDYVANPKSEKRKKLIDLIKKYKKNNVPTVFYSKEDPVSYKEYLSLAKECDYIFTSDNEMIEDYKRDTGNLSVGAISFGINPSYHNPVGKDLTNNYLTNQVTFAGSWMVRYPERNKEALEIFKGVNKTNKSLNIIDRQYERRMKRYHYPPYLLGNVSATIPHERLMRLHKATMWGINLNSVKDSYTMFANRIYEIQAMGNIVISNYNKGVNAKFPNVIISSTRKDVESVIDNLSFNEQKRLIARGISTVMLNHTAYHRLKEIVNAVGFKYDINSPEILVYGNGESSENCFKKQSYPHISYITEEELNANPEVIKNYDFITFFSESINYKEYYIENLLSGFAYTNADVISMNENNYNYVTKSKCIKSSCMIKADVYESYLKHDSKLIYFNIPKTEITGHRTNYDDVNSNKILTIIIPDCELKHIEDKVLLNLYNEEIMNKVDILIIGDKENYEEKKLITNRLKNKFHNLSYHVIDEKNISISNKKNLGLDISTTEFVTFMDSNSQVNAKGYLYMLDMLSTNKNVDLIYGRANRVLKGKYNLNNSSKLLEEIQFVSNTIGSILINKVFLNDNEIRFDEELFNDEELFLLNILSQSKDTIKIDSGIYQSFNSHEERLDNLSVLNESLIMEIKRKKILVDLELTEAFSNKIFSNLFVEKYYRIFLNTSQTERVFALGKLEELLDLYKVYIENNKKVKNIREALLI